MVGGGWFEGTDVIKNCNAETYLTFKVYTLGVQQYRAKRALYSDSASTSNGQQIVQSS